MTKPMLPTYLPEAPHSKEWRYEVKYDGFRAILMITDNTLVKMTSRNGKELLPLFPEISECIKTLNLEGFLPLQLDGELVWLTNESKADFSTIQWRGRLRNKTLIAESSILSPCRFIAFDLITLKGEDISKKTLSERKSILKSLGRDVHLPVPSPHEKNLIQVIESYDTVNEAMDQVILMDGEGIVAKNINSIWEEKRSTSWIKVKNWRIVPCFITALHKENGYVSVAVYKNGVITSIGSVKNGMSAHDKTILHEMIKKNAAEEDTQFFYIHPSICIEVQFLHVYEENELREPQFSQWLLQTAPMECTWERFLISQFTFPDSVSISSPDKPIWSLKNGNLIKVEYLQYLREVSGVFLPFLTDKPLTTIRYPHGTMSDERFFQKNKPEYAPAWIRTVVDEDIEYMLCNDVETLLWFGNQLALEFHAPFQKAGSTMPDEIVLDLDPPSSDYFTLAIKAALEIKKVIDPLHIKSFIKTSGNKGLQIHIPLPEDTFSYKETHIFTDFLGQYLISSFPEDFTIERMKKNRHNRLYLDFVQHSEGKTIIVPYSPRGNHFAGVATPLSWDEVNDSLKLEDYTVETVPNRIKKLGCPFNEYRQTDNGPAFQKVLSFLKQQKTNS
ncbi:DNA ligase D [Peribacillus sp. NPDC097295]|uniref:DNA ligase D n=1 Tax=Peribacillus sp. NPDC097295 TaxID=3364402 RepID=UPI00381CA1FD